jgi:hypothetical protein
MSTGADQHFHGSLVDASRSPRPRRMASTVLAESRMHMTALEYRYPFSLRRCTSTPISSRRLILTTAKAWSEPCTRICKPRCGS